MTRRLFRLLCHHVGHCHHDGEVMTRTTLRKLAFDTPDPTRLHKIETSADNGATWQLLTTVPLLDEPVRRPQHATLEVPGQLDLFGGEV